MPLSCRLWALGARASNLCLLGDETTVARTNKTPAVAASSLRAHTALSSHLPEDGSRMPPSFPARSNWRSKALRSALQSPFHAMRTPSAAVKSLSSYVGETPCAKNSQHFHLTVTDHLLCHRFYSKYFGCVG